MPLAPTLNLEKKRTQFMSVSGRRGTVRTPLIFSSGAEQAETGLREEVTEGDGEVEEEEEESEKTERDGPAQFTHVRKARALRGHHQTWSSQTATLCAGRNWFVSHAEMVSVG
ncbi:hypothetical protein BO99DRAFT_414440 [Aspergillus violaceofuscus CBS 115571]|uniref:Uncharacterized protein n=1 Tax=Aspergillus violaceofuscus (strain CBS 115571) TaxID=1450538 RepID=A0A2V5GZX8_ASPV1|nr:hypothetical protein BO99DRAFT_414440 [Aspergillus violaceofuscus CBS 115571]